MNIIIMYSVRLAYLHELPKDIELPEAPAQ